jgi:hypothetical protein
MIYRAGKLPILLGLRFLPTVLTVTAAKTAAGPVPDWPVTAAPTTTAAIHEQGFRDSR